ncbi:hypothetical protein B9Z19DRAFT_1138104 [Tuber borchii]|uniref:Uncharacterized protein n=1 Tax=Tuber borchii TaxID=42251 RepID=A0A2T6Z9X9_TUBBO|nr:hypothetical protein B9Z19DRAFT_1138104 [Tuber borchii]
MTTGIVYTEVDGRVDTKIEVARVKKALKDEVTKISPTGMRILANQIAYGNEGGWSLLTLMHKLSNNVLALQKQIDDQQCEHSKTIKELTETLQKEHTISTKELTETLQKQVDDQHYKHTESIKELTKTKNTSIKALTETTKALTETTEALTKEVNMLHPPGANAIKIWDRFLLPIVVESVEGNTIAGPQSFPEILLHTVTTYFWTLSFLRAG